MKVKGVNLGNWLVLEKWMNPAIFEGTTAEDEYWLPRQLSREVYEARIKMHRSEYITERDFVTIKSWGMNAVRIPVPYFIFGDCEPFIGCVQELDKAFSWAEKFGLKILIDLHTAPGGQNGFDNGGICGVCKWAQNPDDVEFELSVLERLAKRYGKRQGLWGIEVVNEPLLPKMWENMNLQETYPPADPKMAEGNAAISYEFIRKFYMEAYRRIMKHMDAGKYVVIHDGFELEIWKDFMREEQYSNLVLDTHQYLMVAEAMGCEQSIEGYVKFIEDNYAKRIEEMQKHIPVICGEWCLFNSLACRCASEDEKSEIYQSIAKAQLKAWDRGSGYFYWNYKLLIDTTNEKEKIGWDSWDLGRCINSGWFPTQGVQ